MTLDKKLQRKISKYFSKKKEVGAVYLFGSQIKGGARENSDIDLCVLFAKLRKKSLLSLPEAAYSSDLSEILGKKVEVIDLGSTRIDFAHRVITEAKLLLSNNDDERIKFEEKILSLYFDLKPALDEYFNNLSQIARKGELHVRYLQDQNENSRNKKTYGYIQDSLGDFSTFAKHIEKFIEKFEKKK